MEIMFKGIVGSQAYGTNTPTSDVDIKGVYIQPLREVLSFSYKPQVEVSKDECYYEVKRFLELCMSGNPTMLELLFLPEGCIKEATPTWKLIYESRDIFVTKKCLNAFGGYAMQQIQKAKGLNKKMNWEKERIERKTVIDFCYFSEAGPAIPLTKYLKDNGIREDLVGLVKLDHMSDCYTLFHDQVSQWAVDGNHRFKDEGGEVPTLGFRGIGSEDGNQLLLSSVPKYVKPNPGVLYFNKSEWSRHCKDYGEYTTWLENRNTTRYVDTVEHGQKIDGKNLMHCRRLLDMAAEIAQTGTVAVQRPNKDYLLSIRKGEVKLDDIISKAEEDLKALDELYKNSTLPDGVDLKKVEELLLKIRGL